MSKTDLVSNLLRERARKLSKVEKLVLEIILITRIHQESSRFFGYSYQQYERLVKSNHFEVCVERALKDKEEKVSNMNLMQEIIKDVLATKAYTISGMATHTHIPMDILSDVASGMNANPSLELSKRIFELHMEVRREFYNEIMRKIVSDYLR